MTWIYRFYRPLKRVLLHLNLTKKLTNVKVDNLFFRFIAELLQIFLLEVKKYFPCSIVSRRRKENITMHKIRLRTNYFISLIYEIA